MATQNNAPMPQGVGAAETFDSTIAPATGNVSSIGLPGPPTMEAPQHAGMVNGIDPYFYRQYIAMSQVVWDTSMSAAQLIFSTPIAPQRNHQYMAHLAKMYNVWAGGFDFAVKVAGTGFHAGAVMLVRLPPNIRPDQLRTLADITAFEYTVIDPKTLEVEVKAVMDQRNIMYHYMPLNLENFQTFGGYFAIYVMLPLNTSSTGATQIGLQILTKPAQSPPFMFAQIRPLQLEVANIVVPDDLVSSLDFTVEKTALTTAEQILSFTAYSKKSKVEVTYETINAVTFDGTPMNGYFLPRVQGITSFKIQQVEDFGTRKVQYLHSSTGDQKEVTLIFPAGDSVIFWKHLLFETTETDGYYPQIEKTDGEITVRVTAQNRTRSFIFTGTFDVVDPPDEDLPGALTKFTLTNVTHNLDQFIYGGYNTDYMDNPDDNSELGKNKNISEINFKFNDLKYKFDYRPYAPPIDESIILFQYSSGETVMPFELNIILKSMKYKNLISKNDSLVFELFDIIVNLPILPMRLSYQGLMTTITQSRDLVYKIRSPRRYQFKFVGIIPTSTPLLSGRLPLKDEARYSLHQALSQTSARS